MWQVIKDIISGVVTSLLFTKFISITKDIFVELYYWVIDFIGSNLRNMAIILKVTLPYFMWYLGAYLYEDRGEFAVGGEIFIPLIIFAITGYIRQFANRIGKGERIPLPKERFTEKGEEAGEYRIEEDRIEEMIIYMYNLENWLERKGLMKKFHK